MNPLGFFYIILLLLLNMWALYNVPILAVGAKNRRRGKKEKKPLLNIQDPPLMSIIVPLKDEEKVVSRLLDALLTLNYPRDKRQIILAEDGSNDRTRSICCQYARKHRDEILVVKRRVSDGKPGALNGALPHVKGEIIAVFDADSLPDPDVLSQALIYFQDPSTAAIQGRICSVNEDENLLTKLVSYEAAVWFETYIRGKDALRLFVPIAGSCYFIRRSILEEINGWDKQSLSEDMELTARLTTNGHRAKYAPEVVSWQENPASLRSFFTQRTRWFRGCMEVTLKYGTFAKKLNPRNIDAEVTLAGPYMLACCFVAYLVSLYSMIIPVEPIPIVEIAIQAASLTSLANLTTIGLVLIYATQMWKTRRLIWLPLIYVYWMIEALIATYALIQLVTHMPRQWDKTTKTGNIALQPDTCKLTCD